MLDHPYAHLLGKVERPGRYLGGEYGAAEVPDQARLRMALAFPDAYEIGMSHIGLSVLYQVVNRMEGMSAERVFMPWPDMEAQLVSQGLPLLSLESARPLVEFDLLGFSLQYDLTYTNLIAMLDLGGVPRRAAKRSQEHPIVLAGGPLACHCEPLAPFLDLVLVGDGEDALPELLNALARCVDDGIGRKETIARLHALPFMYSPGLLERRLDETSHRQVVVCDDGPSATRATVSSLNAQPFGNGPVPMINAVFDRFSLEIARGCAEGCRFCQAGFLYRPVRERSPEEAFAAVDQGVNCLGFDEITLAALSSADHSRIEDIVCGLGERFTQDRVSISVPSLRAYGLREELIEVVGRLRASGVTLAPEAGSQRLRDVVNKNVDEADLMSAAARFFDRGFNRIKLYFMLGLPSETDEDLEAIIDLAASLRKMGMSRLSGRRTQIVVSVSTFVPKPFTPFEREEMIGLDEIRRRQALLTRLGKAHKLDVRLHDPRLSRLEGIFSRGDVSLGDHLERAVDLGARFDGWGEMFKEKVWETVFDGHHVDTFLEEIPDEAALPWNHVDVGLTADFLNAERKRAGEALTTRPCGRYGVETGEATEFVCHTCGLRCRRDDVPLRTKREPSVMPTSSPVHKSRGTPRPKPLPGPEVESVRVRLTLAKWGRQAFIGHLDVMRHITRSLRRANLKVLYTRGFHPKPKIETAPPLPLGTSGLAEPMDLHLADPPQDEEILELLRHAVPPDMEVTSIRRLADGDKKLAKALEAAQYVVLLDAIRSDVEAAVEKIIASDSIEIERTRKNKTKKIDVRPFVRDARVLDRIPPDLRLGPTGERVAVEIILEVPGSGGARPAEVLQPFLQNAIETAWIVRTGWILKEG